MNCTQPLLIHVDGTGSCSVPGCLDGGTLTDAVLRHRYVVNCRSALGTGCQVCHRTGSDDDGPTPASAPLGRATASMCAGVATVHVDGSFECSSVTCATKLSRGGWLALHAHVQACRDLADDCALCTVSDDHR